MRDGVHATRGAVDSALGVAHSAQDAAQQVRERSAQLLHQAEDRAVEAYQTARTYAADTAQQLGARAQRVARRTASYARSSGERGGRFVSAHTLPLTALGLSLGWLAWSISRQDRQYGAPPRQGGRRMPTLRRRDTRHDAYDENAWLGRADYDHLAELDRQRSW